MAERGTQLFKLDVLGLPISVMLVDFTDDPADQVYGQYDSYNSLIELDNSSAFHHQRVTLLHELLHCYQDLLGLNNVKHKDVYSISQALYALITHNRDFAEWLTKIPTESSP